MKRKNSNILKKTIKITIVTCVALVVQVCG